jgi:ATP-dependent exoDNAse (exonuclease V) beta subunit
MEILAMTFTNKAAYEMKSRLIAKLSELQQYPQGYSDQLKYAKELAEDLKIAPERLAYRAESCLKKILHNYSAFSVSTIDSFTNRLIRSFSQQLNLSVNFQVEIENDQILLEATDRLLNDLEPDTPATVILTRFIEEEIKEGRAGNSRQAIFEAGKELFSEEAAPYLKQLEKITLADFLRLEKQFRQLKETHQKALQTQARDLITWCEKRNINADCFNRKILWNQLQKMANGDISFFSKTVVAAIEGHSDFHAKSKANQAAPLLAVEDQFRAEISQLVHSWEKLYPDLFLSDKILKSLYGLALLQMLNHYLQELKDESNRLPIGEFNKIVSDNLQQQPAPFLYERLGERYRHFFIDEFQDTSTLQWQNLLPLINNALASDASSALIVGDAKQSIYRFRGGEVQLFIDLLLDRDPSNKVNGQVIYERELVELADNYRSKEAVVGFNNAFFDHCAKQFDDAQIEAIYSNAEQKVKKKDGGYVEVRLTEASHYKQEHLELSLEILRDALHRGYRQKDIALLCLSNADGQALAKFLIDNQTLLDLPEGENLQILSADSLQLHRSVEVAALISFLRMQEHPEDPYLRKDWLYFSQQKLVPEEDLQEALKRRQKTSLDDELKFLEATSIGGLSKKHWLAADLPEKISLLIKALDLNLAQDPYLQLFLDQSSQFVLEESPRLADFLTWWENKGRTQSIILPEGLDAVQIMTIHKAKGLEFPVVICPFIKQPSLSGQKLPKHWKNLMDREGPFSLLSSSLIQAQKTPDPLMPFNREYEAWRQHFEKLDQLDSLNRFYVAFTRAESELYILSIKARESKANYYIEKLLGSFTNSPDNEPFTQGEKVPLVEQEVNSKAKKAWPLSSYSIKSWEDSLEVIDQAPKHWSKAPHAAKAGQKLHQVLAELEKAEDLELILEKAKAFSWFEDPEISLLREQLRQILAHPDLQKYFDGQGQILNERSILQKNNKQRRPDRLVIKEDKSYLLDYKTGKAQASHRQQLDLYAALLEECGLKVAERCLVYLGEEISLDKW